MLQTRVSTRAADVYAFAIVCWEIFTDAAKPFGDYSNQIIKDNVREETQREEKTDPEQRLPPAVPGPCADEARLHREGMLAHRAREAPDHGLRRLPTHTARRCVSRRGKTEEGAGSEATTRSTIRRRTVAKAAARAR